MSAPLTVSYWNSSIADKANLLNFANFFFHFVGEFAISVSSDKKMQFYAGKTGEPSFDVPDAHAGSIYSVAVSPSSAQLMTASADKSVKLWEVSGEAATCVQTYVPVEGAAQVGRALESSI